MTTIDTTTFIGPCELEDSTNCYWNAPTMGNGEGSSFVNLDGTITYIDGCAPGQGLPAVDITPEGTPWAYCEPALGNDQAPMPTCDDGFILAEDLSCVPTSFYDEAPVEGPTDTVFIPETNEIVDEGTGEVLETIETVQAVDEADGTTQLALTGPEDLSPLTVILGLGALLLGIAIRKVAARA